METTNYLKLIKEYGDDMLYDFYEDMREKGVGCPSEQDAKEWLLSVENKIYNADDGK